MATGNESRSPTRTLHRARRRSGGCRPVSGFPAEGQLYVPGGRRISSSAGAEPVSAGYRERHRSGGQAVRKGGSLLRSRSRPTQAKASGLPRRVLRSLQKLVAPDRLVEEIGRVGRRAVGGIGGGGRAVEYGGLPKTSSGKVAAICVPCGLEESFTRWVVDSRAGSSHRRCDAADIGARAGWTAATLAGRDLAGGAETSTLTSAQATRFFASLRTIR